jgi:hypothetical protein
LKFARQLLFLVALALAGCQSPGDPQQLFYEDVLTTEAWFVLAEHPELREPAGRRDFTNPQWRRFHELLLSLTSDPAQQARWRDLAISRALTRPTT